MKKEMIKTTLLQKVEEEKRKKERLKNEYGIDTQKENVIVVEKSNTLKFVLSFSARLTKIMINIMVFIFAFLGFFSALSALLIHLFAPQVLTNILEQLTTVIEIIKS